MDFIEVHSWLGLLGVGVMAAGLIVPAWLAAHRGRKATIQTEKVLDQVRNGHDTPLRVDLDLMRETLVIIHDDIRGIRTDIGGIRSEIRAERSARHDLEQRVDDVEAPRRRRKPTA